VSQRWFWLSVKMKFRQVVFFTVSVSSSRIVATLHITFSWLPLPIGQVCSQVWCRPYLAAHFGFFDLRTFPWSLSQVQVSTFYPFTPKVGSKCTYIILTSSSVKPSNKFCAITSRAAKAKLGTRKISQCRTRGRVNAL